MFFRQILSSTLAVTNLTVISNRNCSLPDFRSSPRRDRRGRKLLLVIVSLVFGMEVAYKFSTRTVIFLLNPCHVITALQIYLLAASPSRFTTAIFRIHINFLNGALLALLFPVTNTLFVSRLPFKYRDVHYVFNKCVISLLLATFRNGNILHSTFHDASNSLLLVTHRRCVLLFKIYG